MFVKKEDLEKSWVDTERHLMMYAWFSLEYVILDQLHLLFIKCFLTVLPLQSTVMGNVSNHNLSFAVTIEI